MNNKTYFIATVKDDYLLIIVDTIKHEAEVVSEKKNKQRFDAELEYIEIEKNINLSN
jgi:hypothetical protein